MSGSEWKVDVDLPWSFVDVDAAWWTNLYKPSEKTSITHDSITVHAERFKIHMRREEITIGSSRYTVHFSDHRGPLIPGSTITLRSMIGGHTRLTVVPISSDPFLDKVSSMAANGHLSENALQMFSKRQAHIRSGMESYMARLLQHFLVWFGADQRLLMGDGEVNTILGVEPVLHSDRPPHPMVAGWDAVFDWFYGYGRPKKHMTLRELASAIGYSLSHVQTMKGLYDAAHGTAIRRKKA